jgi:hypothetical protein
MKTVLCQNLENLYKGEFLGYKLAQKTPGAKILAL